MKTNPKQAAEEHQTARENALRENLKEIEDSIKSMERQREKTLMDLGRCMVKRIDDED